MFKHLKQLNYASSNGVCILLVPLILTLAICTVFYPGFMSYDTLHALRGARGGVTDSMWPPMVSYVWRVIDFVSDNPAAMHFFQTFVLLLSVYYIGFYFCSSHLYATIFTVLLLCIPVILGTIAVIWKDVLMASFFCAAFAITLIIQSKKSPSTIFILSLGVLLLIFLATCSRHNAITGAVPLIFYLSLLICSKLIKGSHRIWLASFLMAVTLISTIYYGKILLDRYSIPTFSKLNNETSLFIESVRVLDVAGASLCVGSNLFGDIGVNMSLEEIKSKYDPKHINLSKELFDSVGVDSRINKVWVHTLLTHPLCFFSNKLELTKYLLGLNSGQQFIITAPAIDKNEFGYTLSESSVRNRVVDYIVYASNLFFLRPWFIYLLSSMGLIWAYSSHRLSGAYLALYASAIFYLAGLIGFGNAADARLPFFTTLILTLTIFLSLNLKRECKK